MDMTPQPLCDLFRITPQEIETRKAFLGFSAEDDENLERLHTLLLDDVDAIIIEFYAHLRRFAELDPFLADPRRLVHLQETQRQYLLSLGRDVDQPAYWEDRLRIGVAHERVGLPQQWYLAAYVKLFELIRRRLTSRYAGQPELLSSLLLSLHRIFTLDAILAVETYYQATVHRLETSLEQLTEAQRALQEMARLDGLTQVDNRSYLMEALEREFQRSRRFAHPFSLLFVDLDHFKKINDRYGHGFGDVVLRQIVAIIRGVLRSADIIGRYGGEEFLIGLVETGAAKALQIAERIRLEVERSRLEANGCSAAMTISIGLATLTADEEKLNTLIDQADQALYRAKETGRNRVCVHRHESGR